MTELTGRELDRCVADIIGWRDCVMAELTKPGSPTHARAVDAATPHYSTDPATQAEKLAWLMRESSSPVYLTVEIEYRSPCDGGTTARLMQRCHDCEGTDQDHVDELGKANGSTVDEALARLVVAVAKERSK